MQNENRKFIYVETAFFSMWWDEQTELTREYVRRLVNDGKFLLFSYLSYACDIFKIFKSIYDSIFSFSIAHILNHDYCLQFGLNSICI